MGLVKGEGKIGAGPGEVVDDQSASAGVLCCVYCYAQQSRPFLEVPGRRSDSGSSSGSGSGSGSGSSRGVGSVCLCTVGEKRHNRF